MMAEREHSDYSVRPQEKILIDRLIDRSGSRALCSTVGRGQLAANLVDRFDNVTLWSIDCFQQSLLTDHVELEPADRVCSSDLPDHEFDLIAFPFSATGEAELVRDLIQQAAKRLAEPGHLVISTDNPKDQWLGDQLSRIFSRVSRHVQESGTIYQCQRKHLHPRVKWKKFEHEFRFRDGERLIDLVTRPGVFAHRRLDTGARRLIQHMELHEGDRVLDLGCGSGAVGLAAAFRAVDVQVHAVDSHARAVECADRSAQTNEASNLQAELSHSGPANEDLAGTFDLVLANPPYFAQNRIAKRFADIALRSLRGGGTALFVTKTPNWYAEHLPAKFVELSIQEDKGYFIVKAQTSPAE